ncbi:HGL326Cp [Eremothecium sinecaudum]|uniref:Vacuolar protein sorting-associated protein 17 n=1 Tax=Eremothecium sinecaudum TaxID=45286 RepID=A0A0X8HV64_9SACH|nr:HGL326Cp [Eremothecium sinecaudum]AMD22014.1 HGL326Cp [Eremothecium sinecaudum]
MASTVPYDPYDQDVDNNPFSEPSIQGNDSIQRSPRLTEDQQENNQPSTSPKPNLLPERKSDKYHLIVKVIGLERVGSLTNRRESPTIIFDVSTNLPTFRKQHHKNLKKAYDEFQLLFEYLNSSIPETFVPALPPSSTSFGINNDEDMQKMILNFRKWMDRICSDPLIIRNEELAFFMESDFNTYSPTHQTKSPVSGLRRKTLKQLPPPYDEVLELAEFRPLVKSIYLTSQDIQAKLLKMSKTRKQLSQEENAFGQGFCGLCVEDERYNRLYQRFGRVITAVGDIDSIMATFDMATLYDSLKWVVRDTYVIKEALTNRHFLMKQLLQVQQNTKLKQDNARKLRAKRDISPLKVDEAIRQLKVATKTEQQLTYKLQRVTENMLIEKRRWTSFLVDSLLSAVREYTLKKIEYERKKLSLLERVRSDVRNVDTQGGLSRLGRELLTPSPVVTPSQSAIQGDAWTADPRASHGAVNTEIDSQLLRSIDGSLGVIQQQSQSQDQDSNGAFLDPRQAATILGTSTF